MPSMMPIYALSSPDLGERVGGGQNARKATIPAVRPGEPWPECCRRPQGLCQKLRRDHPNAGRVGGIGRQQDRGHRQDP